MFTWKTSHIFDTYNKISKKKNTVSSVLEKYTPLAVKICILLWKFFSKIFNFFPKFSFFSQNFHFFLQNFQQNSKFSEIFKFFKISKITIDYEYFPNTG